MATQDALRLQSESLVGCFHAATLAALEAIVAKIRAEVEVGLHMAVLCRYCGCQLISSTPAQPLFVDGVIATGAAAAAATRCREHVHALNQHLVRSPIDLVERIEILVVAQARCRVQLKCRAIHVE